MKCPKCEQKQQHKNGKTKAGSQHHRCYSCGCSYTPEKKVRGHGKAFRQKTIKMYIDGSGLRRTGRQRSILTRTVTNWAKAQAEQLLKLHMTDLQDVTSRPYSSSKSTKYGRTTPNAASILNGWIN